MRLLLLLALHVALVPEGEPTEEPPSSKSFDVDFGFDEDEDEDEPEPGLPEGDAPLDVPEPPPPPPPPPPTGPSIVTVFVPTEPDKMEQGARIAARVTEELAARRGVRALSLRRAIDPNADAAAEESIEAGKRAVAAGVRAFEELDLEKAGAQLDIGVNTLLAYERVLSEDDRQALSAAILAYGTTVLFEGRSDIG